jgi:signal transduction histidine kinase
MSHLVERLLALARIDAGSNPLNLRDIDVPRVVHVAADLIRPLAKAHEVTVEVDAPDALAMRGDADKLHEVLTNLLHNAVEYNRPGGRIDVTVRHLAKQVEIDVHDTGVGIRPEAREHLFERFYRADPSRHTDTPHCGLGLAIVKSYVELMGGRVAVESELGRGTTFQVVLPFAEPASPVTITRRKEAVA